MDPSPVKLPFHDHSLYPSSRFTYATCQSCKIKGLIYGGYRCNDYHYKPVWFHKECIESPMIIDHSSHPDHSLRLTVHGKSCDLCGASPLNIGYYCSICDFNIDTRCGRNLSYKPPEEVLEDPKSNLYPLFLHKELLITGSPCEVCNLTGYNRQPVYQCRQTGLLFHKECVNLSLEVKHPSHPTHLLKLTRSKNLLHDSERTCLLCEQDLVKSLYHCSVCNFSLCLYCVRNPPPIYIEHFKTHSHQLILLASQVEFTCRVCGMQGSRSPYLCLQCGFMVHRSCIDLPRVININRHDHRVSFTPHLGSENLKCPICRHGINSYYGAYSCSICEDYVVHSHCATRNDVWDGIELEEIPEDTDDFASFTKEGDNLIRHFLHRQHILRFHKDGLNIDKNIRCEACVSPVYSNPVYSCEQCDFILHETCAKLPRKKRNIFQVRPLPLKGDHPYGENSLRNWFRCQICETVSSGFRYGYKTYLFMDVICGSFSEPFNRHEPFPPLYLSEEDENNESICIACGNTIGKKRMICSENGKIVLDFRCANLPKMVKHRYDDHLLSLCYGEDVNDEYYWCEICEGKVDTKRWFYTCYECGTTLHIDCVIGDFSNIKVGCVYEERGCPVEVVENNGSFRPLCESCGSRCKGPFFLKVKTNRIEYICSLLCAMSFFRLVKMENSFNVYYLT